jgi:Ca2+-binding RTX toxin-like protein
LINGESNNLLQSGGGDDFLFGGGGDDTLDGETGTDTAVYFGKCSDYAIDRNSDGTWTVRDRNNKYGAGKDTLLNVEKVQFDEGKTFNLTAQGLKCQIDFALVIDTTGSMGASIGSVKAQASALIDALFADGEMDARIAVVGFKDTTSSEPSSVILPFTDQDDFAVRKSTATAAINSITVGGGGDTPETAFDGLLKALDGSIGNWRPGAGTLRIVLFTDAPAKDGALAAQVSNLAQNIGASISSSTTFRSSNIAVNTFSLTGNFSNAQQLISPSDPFASVDFPLVTPNNPVVPDLTTAQVQIFTIFTGPSGSDTAALSKIANDNSGAFFTASTNDDLVRKILEIISAPPLGLPDLVETPNTVKRPTFNGGELILGTNTNDVIVGSSNGDTIAGFGGDDVINGNAGNDSIDGGFGNDLIYGGTGNDTLLGNIGNDTLIGVVRGINNFGIGERDILIGGAGSDTFVLGDSFGIYYNDRNTASSGLNDFAVILDFTPEERIQLKGLAANYIIGNVSIAGYSGTGIYLDDDGIAGLSNNDELIGILSGITPGSLNLSSPTFVYT